MGAQSYFKVTHVQHNLKQRLLAQIYTCAIKASVSEICLQYDE